MAKSTSYQHKIMEIGFDRKKLENIQESQSAYNPEYKVNPRIQELQLELYEEVLRLAKQVLTKHQYKVFILYFVEENTQVEIAKTLKVTQSACYKSLFGNQDYAKGGKRYGGTVKKLKKFYLKDPVILQILREIELEKNKELYED